MERKERIQLSINRIIATEVDSSTRVSPSFFSNLSEVSTMKQMPSRLDAVLRICGEVLFVFCMLYGPILDLKGGSTKFVLISKKTSSVVRVIVNVIFHIRVTDHPWTGKI